ncbi:hypothetical protein [Streptomyces sp. CO7]
MSRAASFATFVLVSLVVMAGAFAGIGQATAPHAQTVADAAPVVATPDDFIWGP